MCKTTWGFLSGLSCLWLRLGQLTAVEAGESSRWLKSLQSQSRTPGRGKEPMYYLYTYICGNENCWLSLSSSGRSRLKAGDTSTARWKFLRSLQSQSSSPYALSLHSTFYWMDIFQSSSLTGANTALFLFSKITRTKIMNKFGVRKTGKIRNKTFCLDKCHQIFDWFK